MDNSNEAPAIVWTEAKTQGGFVINITRRGTSLQPLFDDIKEFCQENNLTPHERYGGSSKSTASPSTTPSSESKSCKKHNVPMMKNRNGKWYHRNGDEFCNGYGYPSEKEGF